MHIDFFGAACSKVCTEQYQAWVKAATEHGYQVNYIDVDLEPEQAGEYGVRTLPTVYVNRGLPLALHGPIAIKEIDKICRGII